MILITKDGRAQISMEVDLGLYDGLNLEVNGCRQRRREKRAKEREELLKSAENANVKVEKSDVLIEVEAQAEEVCEEERFDSEAAAAVEVTADEIIKASDVDVIDDVSLENIEIENLNCAAEIDLKENLTDQADLATISRQSTETQDQELVYKTNTPPAEAIVHSQVFLENSCRRSLVQKDLDTIKGIIFRHDHLKQNIRNVEFGNYTTRKSSDENLFHHRLDMKLCVDTSNLWEGARKYVWKFLGQHEWKVDGGTMLTVNRIHMK